MSGGHLLSAAALLAAGVVLATPALAQSLTGGARDPAPAAAAEPPGAGGNPIFINLQGPGSSRAAATTALRQKTARRGSARVIVGLRRTLQSPDRLSPAQAAAQSNALQAAQNALLGRVLGSSSARADAARFEYIPFVVMNVNVAQLDRLLADPDVANIQEDVVLAPSLSESVPFIKADVVADAGFPGTGFSIAILDTGVDNIHNMFPRSKIASQACYSSNVPAEGAKSVCPGGVLSSTAAGSAVNCALNISGCDHGTHVAGIAAGNSSSPLLRGVARDSRIIAIQVFSRFTACAPPSPSPCAMAYMTDVIKGLERVYALRDSYTIAAANLSLGSGQFKAPCDADEPATTTIIRMLREARIATVIATGNGGFNGVIASPACISEAIAVGSTLDNADTLSSFSNHSELVRLLAPGSNITSSIPDSTVPQNAMGDHSGTSMAAPHVAGAFAQLRHVRAGSTVDDIAAALECTGVSVTRNGITERRIDVDAARAYLLAPPSTHKAFSFASAAEAAQWTPHTGNWSVAGGSYNLTRFDKGWKASTTDSCNESQTITAVLKRNWPANTRNNTGIVFKAQYSPISAVGKQFSGYAAFISRDLPGNDHPVNVTLWRFDRLNLVNGLVNKSTLLCSKDVDTITSGVFYNLKVVTTGGLHRVYVNNVPRCEANDRTYGTGRAGVMTYIEATGAANAFNIKSFVIDPTEIVPPAADVAVAK